MSKTFIKFKNASKNRVIVEDLGINVAPGETCQIEEGYALPRRSHAGGRSASVIEQLAGCPGCPEHTKGVTTEGQPNHLPHCLLAPVDEADAERFAKAPLADGSPPKKIKMPTVHDMVASGVPRGVAEQLVKAAMAAAQAARSGELEQDEPKAPPAKESSKAKPAQASEEK